MTCGAPCPPQAAVPRRSRRPRFPPSPNPPSRRTPAPRALAAEVSAHRAQDRPVLLPQRQTQVMNEGWATYWHHPAQPLYDEGLLTDSFMLGSCTPHTNVVYQPQLQTTLVPRHQPLRPRLCHVAGHPPHLRKPPPTRTIGSPTSPAATGARPSTSPCATSGQASSPSSCHPR